VDEYKRLDLEETLRVSTEFGGDPVCGYHRTPEHDGKYVQGYCALTGNHCRKYMPVIEADCKIIANYFKTREIFGDD